jgi:hypothetical protein
MATQRDLGRDGDLDVADRFLRWAEEHDAASGDGRAWTIVLEFYAAVHWVRAYIRHKQPGAQIANHDDVRNFFEAMPELQKVKRSYDFLKQASQSVRYYGQLSWAVDGYAKTRTAARQVRGWAVPLCKTG